MRTGAANSSPTLLRAATSDRGPCGSPSAAQTQSVHPPRLQHNADVKAAFWKAMACAILAGCSSGAATGGHDGGPGGSGGGGGGAGGTGAGSIALDDFADAVVTAVCQRAVDCSLYPDVATCAATTYAAEGKPVEVAALAKSGVTQYDPVAAAACLAALPHDCWYSYDWFLAKWQFFNTEICRKVFKGTVAGTGRCCSGIECVSQLCSVDVGACDATPLVSLGGHCDQSASLYCDFGLLCSPEGTCTAPLPIGANCADQPWQVCEAPSACSSAAAGSSMPGICTALPDEGEACDETSPQACRRVDDYCDTGTNVCTRRLPPGAACQRNTAIGSYNCVAYAVCVDGICVSELGPGGSCTIGGLGTPCMDGFPCMNNVCSPASPPTALCKP